jgi:asparagine synthase (glutamine-hydrolysing)
MGRAMARWGAISVATRPEGVLGCALLPITPEAEHESSPFHDPETGLSFTAAARLDNRTDLCDQFGIPQADRPELADGHLVFLAHRRWGEAAPRHLAGDWSYAAWDGSRRRLFLARDQLGNTGLFFHRWRNLLAFASDPEGLFGLPHVTRRINERKLAGYLGLGSLTEPFETQWEAIHRLLPGFALAVTAEAGQPARYWAPEDAPALDLRSDEACLEAFLEHYRRAVKVRLRSIRPIGATLSAGLDSGSVTVLAAQALAAEDRPLTTFTSVPLGLAAPLRGGQLVDEGPLARLVSSRFPGILHLPLRAEAISPVAGIHQVVGLAHAPLHAANNGYWILAMLREARSRGLGVLLTGQSGNGGVSWDGGRYRIFHLFASGRWDEGRKALALWRAYHGRSWFEALAVHVVRPLVGPWTGLAGLGRGGAGPGQHLVQRALARRLGLERALALERRPAARMQPLEERRRTLMVNAGFGGHLWHLFGAVSGLEVRDPTADLQLLTFCLGVPQAQFTFGGGDRMLMRRAMEGLLPPEVQWNRARGVQASDLAVRIRLHPAEMESTLERFGASRAIPAFLDLPALRGTWERFSRLSGADLGLGAHLLRGVMAGCFIDESERLGAL